MDAIFMLLSLLDSNKKFKRQLLWCFIDFKKAFDSSSPMGETGNNGYE